METPKTVSPWHPDRKYCRETPSVASRHLPRKPGGGECVAASLAGLGGGGMGWRGDLVVDWCECWGCDRGVWHGDCHWYGCMAALVACLNE